jgi:hypothetical protein
MGSDEVSMKNRPWNKAYAKFNGYFWLPCPLCGQMFGGHEWGETIYDQIPTDKEGSFKGICPDCGKIRQMAGIDRGLSSLTAGKDVGTRYDHRDYWH